MIRVMNARMRFALANTQGHRAAALSRRALELLAERPEASASEGAIERLQISVRVSSNASGESVARAIADAIATRLSSSARGR